MFNFAGMLEESQGQDVDNYLEAYAERKRFEEESAVECSICLEKVNKEDVAPECDWLKPDEPVCEICINGIIDAENNEGE